jgi:ethanolamine-phosphate cytidylyltransferase
VIYVDGGFDLFHAGHTELFKAAKKLGNYLVVGIHDDQVTKKSIFVGSSRW